MIGEAGGTIVTRIGPSYRVDDTTLDATFYFRDVRSSGDLRADVSVEVRDTHVLRTETSLSLVGRDRLAREIHAMLGHQLGTTITDLGGWKGAVHVAAEMVLMAEEDMADGADLRAAPIVIGRPSFIVRPMIPDGISAIVAPGESGKSTVVRALAVSIATGVEVIPGLVPATTGPVLYVAAEDPVLEWHARSIEAICRGAGINRATIPHLVRMQDVRGRKLHRIGRALAERASDYAVVIVDSVQALLPSLDSVGGGIRDRDSIFYDALDLIARPVLVVAHPNLAGARKWSDADGRVAGSEVNRDRLRMSSRLNYVDEKAVPGTSYRRYTLACTKFNHGPRYDPIGFAASWTFGVGDDDPGVVRFHPTQPDPVRDMSGTNTVSPALARTAEEWGRGRRSVADIAAALGISEEAAKKRIQRARADRLIEGGGDDE